MRARRDGAGNRESMSPGGCRAEQHRAHVPAGARDAVTRTALQKRGETRCSRAGHVVLKDNDMSHEQYKRTAEIDRHWERIHLDAGHEQAAAERAVHAEQMERMAEATRDALDLPMPTLNAVYAFLRDEYLNSRFEGRNAHWPEGGSYSEYVARGYVSALERDGIAGISHFESRRGKPVVFNRALRILNDDAPVVEIKYRAGSLASPMAGNW